MDNAINLFCAAVLAGTPLLIGTLGDMLSAKSGSLNLGVEGMMFMGAASGLVAAYGCEKMTLALFGVSSGLLASLAALLFSFIVGALGALVYAFLTITLRANQNVTGLALSIFGMGFGNFFGEYMGLSVGGYVAVGGPVKDAFQQLHIPFLSDIPVLGQLLFSYNWIVYFGIALALLLHFFLSRTRIGLNLRAVGENPATADAAGIPVTRYKYVATVIGGGICGVGGMYMVMVTCSGVWVPGCVNGYGWLAVALTIFAAWKPLQALAAALLFGCLSVARMYLPFGVPMQLYDMLPYVATALVLVITSVRGSQERAQPAACGVNYFREDR